VITKGEGFKNNTAVLTNKAISLLWDWGLHVNGELKSLNCWTCKQGIEPKPTRTIKHLKKNTAGKARLSRGRTLSSFQA